ncbi:MAG: glycosyltransferase family 4 protein [Verrucomicrobiota bacterium]
MSKPVRVLYSFPNRLGAQRICYAAWQQINGLVRAGAKVHAMAASFERPLPAGARADATLTWGKLKLPFKLLGHARTLALHDRIVASRLKRMAGQVDIIHLWPMGALHTLRVAKAMKIPTILERPNAHTKFAYEVVEQECKRLGITMPPGHEHAYNEKYLRHEEAEYALADRLLCPSDFVKQTFLDLGFPNEQLARHQYGFDEKFCHANGRSKEAKPGLTVLFAGGCAPRKGLHYALEAWLKSSAHKNGKFLILGEFIPGYAELLQPMLSHPSVQRLGWRKDYPSVMRESDILVLPSIEEGSALVTSDGRGCGCVLLVSDAAGAICQHGVNALVHRPRDVETLAKHLSQLHEDRALLEKLRTTSLSTVDELTWNTAGERLFQVYQDTLAARR